MGQLTGKLPGILEFSTNQVHRIIEDPDLCQPVFSSLICSSSTTNKSTCLSGAQAARVAGVFSAFYGQNGTMLFPRLQPGAELSAYYIYLDAQPFPYTVDWFRYAVLSDPTWDPTTFTLADATLADKMNLFNISTFDADLYGFKNAGGKILTYQGMQDQVITSDNSERYYKKLAQTMNLPPSDLDAFYRYFRISGMGHCAGGPGAWNIGQAYSADPKSFEPEDNILLAMVNWVEKGVAPDFVRGTKYVNDTAALGVDFRRKHCKFPTRNRYVGPGNYTDENAWKCVLDLGTVM
jgi:feruloyl esterase